MDDDCDKPRIAVNGIFCISVRTFFYLNSKALYLNAPFFSAVDGPGVALHALLYSYVVYSCV
jgi:hypothetical protein